ncbi:MAG: trimethylamine methyltransferase family protein, partial [Gammaproteobacteria bacterium]|nr:trimethylamine methyltransferase family protein [Gammaproteobacteria bacterium]
MQKSTRKRSGRRSRPQTHNPEPAGIAYLNRQIPDTQLLNAEGLELIEHNADTILEEIGIDFRYEPAKKLFRA